MSTNLLHQQGKQSNGINLDMTECTIHFHRQEVQTPTLKAGRLALLPSGRIACSQHTVCEMALAVANHAGDARCQCVSQRGDALDARVQLVAGAHDVGERVLGAVAGRRQAVGAQRLLCAGALSDLLLDGPVCPARAQMLASQKLLVHRGTWCRQSFQGEAPLAHAGGKLTHVSLCSLGLKPGAVCALYPVAFT